MEHLVGSFLPPLLSSIAETYINMYCLYVLVLFRRLVRWLPGFPPDLLRHLSACYFLAFLAVRWAVRDSARAAAFFLRLWPFISP